MQTSTQHLVDDLIELMPTITRRAKLHPGSLSECPGGLLAYSEMRILLHLAIYQEDSVGVVADAIAMSRPAVTEAIDRLVAKGLVERLPSDADRRRVLLRLTREASEFTGLLVERWRQVFLTTLEHLTPEEQSGFVKGLKALSLALSDPATDRATARAEAASPTH
jgi:DNA-binding MarR family transcriptional regulator